MISAKELAHYGALGYARVPVVREVLADFDTPVSAYQKVAAGPFSYLFESVQGGEQRGRYSIIGLPAKEVLRVANGKVTLTNATGTSTQATENPLAFIEAYRQRFVCPEIPGLPRFNGGLVGYFSYDSATYFLPELNLGSGEDTLGVPDILLMRSEEVVVFDNLRGSLFFIVLVDPKQQDALAQAEQRIDQLQDKLRQPLPEQPLQAIAEPLDETDFVSEFPAPKFKAAVTYLQEKITQGEVEQVVPSQRMSVAFDADPMSLYRALRHLNPSPYMYYLDLDDFHIAGSSPEILSRVEQGVVTVRPIAGTRPRGKTAEEDALMEQELLADPKEVSEHEMLIDLGIEDIAKLADEDTIEVTDRMMVERYSHVMHLVSNVSGRLREGESLIDVLRVTLPAGTLSGAPKLRAMELIDEVEPVKRGIYGGAIGYMGFNGGMDQAIAIRTAIIKEGRLYLQAGAGVVADSVAESEWQETLNKGRAIFAAVNMVLRGLTPEQAVLAATKEK
ncbi:MAG TPA: chorismate-binding protein [Alcanivoracaceae bacterium]|nr:chorismate-binding protein [Alcanivoracaceae bacterium]